MANRKIPYTTRDFQAIRTELQNYVRTYYPELIQDFNDASVFSRALLFVGELILLFVNLLLILLIGESIFKLL